MNSVATSIMNRNGRVVRCLRSWVEWEGCDELVLVDWSSRRPVEEFLNKQKFFNKKIKIIRVDAEKYFSRSKSFNLAVRNCTYNNIIKIDIDYVLTNKKILEKHLKKAFQPKSFAHSSTGSHLTGFCAFNAEDFEKIGGYNEALEDWGYEDEDLYSRLAKSGLSEFHIKKPKEFLFHIPHSNALSVKNHKNKNKRKTKLRNAKLCNEEDYRELVKMANKGKLSVSERIEKASEENIKAKSKMGRARFLRAQAKSECENKVFAPAGKVIFPQSFVRSVEKMPEEKIYDYCFMGAFAFWDKFNKKSAKKTQEIGFNNRKWVIDYAKKNFTEKSIFINTSGEINLKDGWQSLGAFDKTFSGKGCLPKSMENKGVFDEYYYKTMKMSCFTLCPAGDRPWSIRFFEALMCKSIPVVEKHCHAWRIQEEKNAGYFYYLHSDEKVYSKEIAEENYQLFIKNHTFL